MTGSLLRVRLALPLLAFVAILIVPAYADLPACSTCDCFTSELTYDGGEFLGWREVHENGSTDAISVASSHLPAARSIAGQMEDTYSIPAADIAPTFIMKVMPSVLKPPGCETLD
jgi:hypothetical protein